MFFSFGFAEQLFQPFSEFRQLRFVSNEHFHAFIAMVEVVSGNGVLVARIGENVGIVEILSRIGSPLHQLFNVVSGDGDRKQADGGQHRITPSDVVGNHEAGISFGFGFRFQRAARFIGRGVNGFASLFLADFGNQQFFQ